MEHQFNPAIEAVVRLRRIALDILDSNTTIKDTYHESIEKLQRAIHLIAPERIVLNEWTSIKTNLDNSANNLIGILNKLTQRFKEKNVKDISSVWNEYKINSTLLQSDLQQLRKLGEVAINDKDAMAEWNNLWETINANFNKIKSIVESYKLKLDAIEKLAPTEIDEITNDILKHIPVHYTEEQAYQYEKEYLQALKELKEIAKSKNLWDKILDLLAGGYQETPAHRVAMMRWLEGES